MSGVDDRRSSQGSLWRTVRAVAWAMLGVRNGDEFRKDQESLRPLQVVGIALVALFLLVLLLMGVVYWVV
ncbi:MAG: DUF2970 domain-containing protein [Comamonadaceae bacterium]|nr:DUF2970 domain-containing protein [Pseudomonadota bacterium]MDE2415485.1 DUF2970 domain-containing protein [Comamonadaceae bacterium]